MKIVWILFEYLLKIFGIFFWEFFENFFEKVFPPPKKNPGYAPDSKGGFGRQSCNGTIGPEAIKTIASLCPTLGLKVTQRKVKSLGRKGKSREHYRNLEFQL